MKNSTLFILILFMLFAAGVACADENPKVESWKPGLSLIAGVHNAYMDEGAGYATFRKSLVSQSATLYIEKDDTGFYVQAENFSPSEQEFRETDFYAGFYTAAAGFKVDAGYAYYWVREEAAISDHVIYGSVHSPPLIWEVRAFIKGEYRFAKNRITEENVSGFIYYGGLKREFKLHDRISLTSEISLGGNTGLYGMPAENLSFAREKLELKVLLTDNVSIKCAGLTQQNLGKQNGIAADTDRLFASAAVVLTF